MDSSSSEPYFTNGWVTNALSLTQAECQSTYDQAVEKSQAYGKTRYKNIPMDQETYPRAYKYHYNTTISGDPPSTEEKTGYVFASSDQVLRFRNKQKVARAKARSNKKKTNNTATATTTTSSTATEAGDYHTPRNQKNPLGLTLRTCENVYTEAQSQGETEAKGWTRDTPYTVERMDPGRYPGAFEYRYEMKHGRQFGPFKPSKEWRTGYVFATLQQERDHRYNTRVKGSKEGWKNKITNTKSGTSTTPSVTSGYSSTSTLTQSGDGSDACTASSSSSQPSLPRKSKLNPLRLTYEQTCNTVYTESQAGARPEPKGSTRASLYTVGLMDQTKYPGSFYYTYVDDQFSDSVGPKALTTGYVFACPEHEKAFNAELRSHGSRNTWATRRANEVFDKKPSVTSGYSPSPSNTMTSSPATPSAAYVASSASQPQTLSGYTPQRVRPSAPRGTASSRKDQNRRRLKVENTYASPSSTEAFEDDREQTPRTYQPHPTTVSAVPPLFMSPPLTDGYNSACSPSSTLRNEETGSLQSSGALNFPLSASSPFGTHTGLQLSLDPNQESFWDPLTSDGSLTPQPAPEVPYHLPNSASTPLTQWTDWPPSTLCNDLTDPMLQMTGNPESTSSAYPDDMGSMFPNQESFWDSLTSDGSLTPQPAPRMMTHSSNSASTPFTPWMIAQSNYGPDPPATPSLDTSYDQNPDDQNAYDQNAGVQQTPGMSSPVTSEHLIFYPEPYWDGEKFTNQHYTVEGDHPPPLSQQAMTYTPDPLYTVEGDHPQPSFQKRMTYAESGGHHHHHQTFGDEQPSDGGEIVQYNRAYYKGHGGYDGNDEDLMDWNGEVGF